MHMKSHAVAMAIALSKMLPRWDIYTGLYVPKRLYSREHIVPKSVLQKAGLNHAMLDLNNLYCVDTAVNCMRSNYKYVDGDPAHMREIVEDADAKLVMMSSGMLAEDTHSNMGTVICTRTSGSVITVSVCFEGTIMTVDNSKRTVVPPVIARGAIARSVYKMYDRYDCLFDYRHLILDEDVMTRWLKLPRYNAEIKHDEFLRSLK
ncbi:hypothetical protein JKP88DRAFT_251626 [Tribonema minus]|uniref:Uncharacterized protein n=1 Tax=Tribonema minus TaxID=303371 RepID=A0A835ZDX4_9STRA|nr:hypothetical protein JKP88DRAFT_251626 [Tribonema minus]